MKQSLRKPKPLSAAGYGERIRRAIWHRQSQAGGKVTLAAVGSLVAKMIGRKTDFTAGTVSGWLEERSEPELAVFLALSQWAGVSVGFLAFGDAARENAFYESATETPQGYYKNVTEEPGAAASKAKRGGA